MSTFLLRDTAVGDWAWMRRCRPSMKLLREAASPHCPGVSSVGWGCPCRDVACSSVIRLMLLGSTVVSFRAHRAVTRLLVCGRGCDCVGSACSCRCCLRPVIVLVLSSCGGAAPVLTCRARRCLRRRSSVRRSWMRPLAHPPCCHAAGSLWTWMRLSRSSVQLPRPASSPCDGTTRVPSTLARHCSGQRLSVRQSNMVVQAYHQRAPPTTRVHCLSTSRLRSYKSTLTSVSRRRCLVGSRAM